MKNSKGISVEVSRAILTLRLAYKYTSSCSALLKHFVFVFWADNQTQTKNIPASHGHEHEGRLVYYYEF